MGKEYSMPDLTLEALINLGAKSKFVKFSSIVNEVKRIKLEKGQMDEPSNFKTRIKRSLINDEAVHAVRGTDQSKAISINQKFTEYRVTPETKIFFDHNGLAKTKDVENNKFKLLVRKTN